MKWIIVCLFILTGCSTKTMSTNSTIDYKPVPQEIIKGVSPYGEKPKPTLKEKIEHEQYLECIEKAEKPHNPFETRKQPSILQEILNHYSCS